jgi:hypothetical protein
MKDLWQNWVVGDCEESCIPLGNQTKEEHGLHRNILVVKARTAKEAIEIAEEEYRNQQEHRGHFPSKR